MKKKSNVDVEDLSLIDNGEPSFEKQDPIVYDLGRIPKTEDPTEVELLEEEQPSMVSATEPIPVTEPVSMPVNQSTYPVNSFYCQTCGSYYASLGVVGCVFCGSKQVTRIDNVNMSDYYVLPFVDTLNDAIEDYKKKVKFNPLVPSIFRKKKTISRIQKVYIPCVLYQAEVGGKISFLGAEKVKGVKAIPTQTFETGYTANFSFPQLLLCGYSKIKDEMFSTISDYNFSVMKPFQTSLLQDTNVFYSDEDIDGNRLRVQEKIMKYAIHAVRADVPHTLKKLKDNQMKVEIQKETKVFVPAYLLDVRYHGENYIYIKNAHTGKSTIDLVSSVKNIILFSTFTFAVVFLLLFLLLFLM